MRLVAITPVRNESWVLRYSARAALTWVDEIVFLDHASTDATWEIIAELASEYPGRIHGAGIDDPTWDEMNHRQMLLEAARNRGATHIATLDADEVLSANFREPVRQMTAMLAPGCMLHLPLHNLWRSLDAYRNDAFSLFGCSWACATFRDAPDLGWQPKEDGYQHHSRAPENALPGLRLPRTERVDSLIKLGSYERGSHSPNDPVAQFYLSLRDAGGLMHLQHASWDRLRAKQALYQMVEAIRWPHRSRDGVRELYSAAVDERGARFKAVPPEWWDYDISRNLIELDAEPWQEAEIHRLLREYGREAFDGLDLFGVQEVKD